MATTKTNPTPANIVRSDSRNLLQMIWAMFRGAAYYGEEMLCEAGATGTTLLRSTREVTDLGADELRKHIKG